jgi:hypothetical protein
VAEPHVLVGHAIRSIRLIIMYCRVTVMNTGLHTVNTNTNGRSVNNADLMRRMRRWKEQEMSYESVMRMNDAGLGRDSGIRASG